MSNAVTSCVLVGVDPRPVRIEASLSGGRHQFIIVGLPDTAVREARERVRAAMKSSGFEFPTGRVVVSLSPADLPKGGSMYDLPIALSLIQATEGLGAGVREFVTIGELSLHGSIEPTTSCMVAAAVAEQQAATAIVPAGSRIPVFSEASVTGAATLREAVEIVQGRREGRAVDVVAGTDTSQPDMADVQGQATARRGMEIAAAGGHHMFMIGPPGSGKSMLAARLPSILPPLDDRQQRTVALVAAATKDTQPTGGPPFRAPHHSISIPALVGGGAGVPTPGEITKAHLGVLFLDELGEFPPSVLDALRQPMEDGDVLVSRQAASIRFPAEIQVIAASNPCPCGFRDHRKKNCDCSPSRRERYRARLSGPLLDRFDIRIRVERVPPADLTMGNAESSAAIRERVLSARTRQVERGTLNRDLTATQMASMEDQAGMAAFLRSEPCVANITARGWNRVRRVARTIADLDGADRTDVVHVKEAVLLRDDV